jgi:hypothetical protein
MAGPPTQPRAAARRSSSARHLSLPPSLVGPPASPCPHAATPVRPRWIGAQHRIPSPVPENHRWLKEEADPKPSVEGGSQPIVFSPVEGGPARSYPPAAPPSVILSHHQPSLATPIPLLVGGQPWCPPPRW